MKILITGFEPFNNSPINPSQEIVNNINLDFPEHIAFERCSLPVDAKAGPELLLNKLAFINPDIVVCIGQASGRASISLEKVAINLLDFNIPDNSGKIIRSEKINSNAPDGYFSSLPVEKIVEQLLSADIPCEISFSAGTYLCNHVFFTLMHYIRSNKLKTKAGFIHLPALPQQAIISKKNLPSMSLELMLKAIPIILETTIRCN